MTAHNADFITKLLQVEQLADTVNGELPETVLLPKIRIQHIVMLAKNLRARLELGSVAIVAVEPRVPPAGEANARPL